MPGWNFGGFGAIVGTCLSIPAFCVLIATLLAGSSGARADRHLPALRRLVATIVGELFGCVVLVGLILAGWDASAESLIACCVLWLMAVVGGPLTAYNVARVVARQLDRYRCRVCRVRFRCRVPAERCPRCEAAADRAAVEGALAEFQGQYRNLPPAK